MSKSVNTLAEVYDWFRYSTSTTPIASFPVTIFGFLHATRIACAYRGAARQGGYEHRLNFIQAALAPLVLILGGSTMVSILLGGIPGWIISPAPILTYGLLPVLIGKSPVTSILLSIPPLPRELLFSCVDGFSRSIGITTGGVDLVLSHGNPQVSSSPWAMVMVALISGGGGGVLVPTFNLFSVEWGFSKTPAWISDGPAIDIWGAAFIGYVYSTLINAHPVFKLVVIQIVQFIPLLDTILPKGYIEGTEPMVPITEAKAFSALLLGSMLVMRTTYYQLISAPAPAPARVAASPAKTKRKNSPPPVPKDVTKEDVNPSNGVSADLASTPATPKRPRKNKPKA